MANALWVSKEFEPYDSYLDVTREVYLADTEIIDVTDSQKSALQINDWVSDNTRGKINQVIQPIDITRYTAMILTNTLYFKGVWLEPFPVDSTMNFGSIQTNLYKQIL